MRHGVRLAAPRLRPINTLAARPCSVLGSLLLPLSPPRDVGRRPQSAPRAAWNAARRLPRGASPATAHALAPSAAGPLEAARRTFPPGPGAALGAPPAPSRTEDCLGAQAFVDLVFASFALQNGRPSRARRLEKRSRLCARPVPPALLCASRSARRGLDPPPPRGAMRRPLPTPAPLLRFPLSQASGTRTPSRLRGQSSRGADPAPRASSALLCQALPLAHGAPAPPAPGTSTLPTLHSANLPSCPSHLTAAPEPLDTSRMSGPRAAQRTQHAPKDGMEAPRPLPSNLALIGPAHYPPSEQIQHDPARARTLWNGHPAPLFLSLFLPVSLSVSLPSHLSFCSWRGRRWAARGAFRGCAFPAGVW